MDLPNILGFAAAISLATACLAGNKPVPQASPAWELPAEERVEGPWTPQEGSISDHLTVSVEKVLNNSQVIVRTETSGALLLTLGRPMSYFAAKQFYYAHGLFLEKEVHGSITYFRLCVGIVWQIPLLSVEPYTMPSTPLPAPTPTPRPI